MNNGFVQALICLLCIAWSSLVLADAKTVELEVNGKTALGDLVVPDGASIKDGVLLLTHGTLAHKDQELVDTLQTALADRGITTLAHTLTLGQDRREGMYDCTKSHVHAHEDAVAEIAAWVDWLRENGAGRVSVLGHSRGGNQVAWFASEKGDANKVVLMAPGSGHTFEQNRASYKERFDADLAPLLEKATKLAGANEPGTMIDVPGFLYCQKGKASARSIVSYYGEEPRQDTVTHMGKVKAPVLVIAGSKDTVVPDVPEKFKAIADGQRVRLEVIHDAGHMFLDFYAEDAADLISEFLKD